MNQEAFRKRFGAIAIRRGFISKDQFVEGMAMQIENDLEGIEPRLFGEILIRMGYLSEQQVDEVLDEMGQ